MKRMSVLVLALVSLASFCLANPDATKTYGKAPTVKEPVTITTVKAEPAKYKDQTVLISGRVVDVCRHAGCWVEVEAPDSSRIICKSLDESISFPKDVVGRMIQVQGKVMYDAKAPGAQTKTEGGEAHACPAPQVLISIEGATVAAMDEQTPGPKAVE
jgi:hypothetical protein